MMQQRKSKRVLTYFLFLMIISSTNNIDLNKVNFDIVKDIKISGLNNIQEENLIKEIKKIDLKSIFFLNDKEIKRIINENTLIEEYEIFKKYPSSLYIKIQKTKFLAKINIEGTTYLVGSNGKLSSNYLSDKDLPYIFGNPDILEFLNLINTIKDTNISHNQINKFFFYKSRRWDLKLNNDITLKLPDKNIKDALDSAYEFVKNKNFDKNKIIDLRIEGQIIVNE